MRLSYGSSVNVLFELELAGSEDILIQFPLLKLSVTEDTLKVPEQEVLSELVVTEVLSIASEKVTEMLLLIETPLWLSVGEIDETVGAVVSVVTVNVSVVTVKEVIVREPLNFFSEFSVAIVLETVIVQSAYVPSLRELKVMVLLPEVAEAVLEEHEPP